MKTQKTWTILQRYYVLTLIGWLVHYRVAYYHLLKYIGN